MNKILVSVVLPVHNEAACLPELNNRLCKALETITKEYEVIYVNDASTDESLGLMLSFHEKNDHVKIIDLSRNFGQQQAISAGLDSAGGDFVVIMDSDLQDCPEDIPIFFKKILEGYDVVYAVRQQRKESFLKRFCFRLFYRILNLLSHVHQPVDSGIFSMMRRCAVDELCKMTERNKYVAGLRAFVGFRQIGVLSSRGARINSSPKNRMPSLLRLAFDAIFSFSYIPLRFGTYFGLIGAFFCFCWVSFIVLLRVLAYFNIIADRVVVRGLPTILIIQVIFGSLILISLGIIGEYIGRIYDEVKQRPYYIVKKRIGSFSKV
ncbi:MAG TPA: glycosyltransferase [Candidatus Omnitrophica bacterium]|nr:glycosyltransferase [Candidatus Omnitrophota bacterium]